MATSVQLRACGGIEPYTWSKTGGVQLSSTTGTQITASVTPNLYTAHDQPAFLKSLSLQGWQTFDQGPGGFARCMGGNLSDWDNITGTAYYCDGTVDLAVVGTSATIVGHFINCGDGSALTDTDLSSFNGIVASQGTISVSATGHTYSTSITTGPDTGNVSTNLSLSGQVDMRSQAMIDAGCNDCASDLVGATVTVTDDAGVSVTYTF